MLKIDGHAIMRSGDKIGFIDGDHIKNHAGDKLGYFDNDHVYDMHGHKQAYLQEDYIYISNSSHKIRIEDNNQDIEGGSLSNIQNAAVRVLLGE